MALFQSFKDTIFVKRSSDCITKLQTINDHFDVIEQKDQVARDIEYTNLNIKVEKQIEYILEGANIGMFVLHDLHIHYQDMVQHIDYAIVTPARVFNTSWIKKIYYKMNLIDLFNWIHFLFCQFFKLFLLYMLYGVVICDIMCLGV